jgi:transcription elongation factor SPT6
MIAKDRPCMFFLIFKHPNNNQRTEYVAAKQSGYMFRQKMYSTVDDLLNAFKQEEQAKSSQNSRMRAVPSGSQMRGSAPRPR